MSDTSKLYCEWHFISANSTPYVNMYKTDCGHEGYVSTGMQVGRFVLNEGTNEHIKFCQFCGHQIYTASDIEVLEDVNKEE